MTERVDTLGGDSVGYESTLERDFAHLLDFNARVGKIISQPLRIRYQVGDGGVQTC